MTKTFKKDQQVLLVSSWDDKGTFYIQPCVVYSAGQKRMVLHHSVTGEFIGRDFLPQQEQRSGFQHVLTDTDMDKATAFALDLSARYLARRVANNDFAISKSSPDFAKVLAESIKELHEPRVIVR